MRKLLEYSVISVSLALLGFAAILGGQIAMAPSPRAMVYEVVYYTDDAPQWFGSGVLIAPQVMLTAAHIVEGAKDGVFLVGPGKVPARVLRVDPDKDLAILMVALDCPCAEIGDTPAPGVDVVAFGFMHWDWHGIVFETHGLSQGIGKRRVNGLFVYTAPGGPGSSGGGVFVDGKLVAITQMGFGSPVANIMSGASADTIREFLTQQAPAELGAVK